MVEYKDPITGRKYNITGSILDGVTQNPDGSYSDSFGTKLVKISSNIFDSEVPATTLPKSQEQRDQEDKAFAKGLLFLGVVATLPVWGAFWLSKKIFNAAAPHSQHNGLKAVVTTAALFATPPILVSTLNDIENDRAREFPALMVYANDAGQIFVGKGHDHAVADAQAQEACTHNSCREIFYRRATGPFCAAIIPWNADGRVYYSHEVGKPAEIREEAAQRCDQLSRSGTFCSPAAIFYTCNNERARQTMENLGVSGP